MPSTAALDANYAVRLWRKKGGRYYAAIDSLALFGSGDTSDAAMAELDRRFGELQAFGNETGVSAGGITVAYESRGRCRAPLVFLSR